MGVNVKKVNLEKGLIREIVVFSYTPFSVWCLLTLATIIIKYWSDNVPVSVEITLSSSYIHSYLKNRQQFIATMQSMINAVKGTALGVAGYLTPVLKVREKSWIFFYYFIMFFFFFVNNDELLFHPQLFLCIIISLLKEFSFTTTEKC